MKKRILPLLLSLILCLSFLPAAFAAPAEDSPVARPEPAATEEPAAPAEEPAATEEPAAPAEAPVPDKTDALPLTPELPTASVVDSGDCGVSGDNVQWTLYSDGELRITGTGPMEDYPSDYPGFYTYQNDITYLTVKEGVTYIGEYAFYNLPNLQSATVAASVTSLGMYAFDRCSSMTNILFQGFAPSFGRDVFEDTNYLYVQYYPIGSGWSNVTGSTYGGSGLTWEKLDQCGANVVWNLSDAGKLTITANTTGSEMWNFDLPNWYYVRGIITEVEVGYGVTSVGDYAFYYLANLKKVTLPDSVTRIGEYAFAHCKVMRPMLMPKNLTTICDSAFYDCEALTSMVLPATVTSVERDAFYADPALAELVFTGHVPEIGDRVFYGDNITVYYPSTDSSWSASGTLAQTFGASSIKWMPVKTGSVGKVELTGSKPVTGTVPVDDIALASVNCGVEIVSFEWRNGQNSTVPAKVFQGGEYPYLRVTLRAFDCCSVSRSTYISFTDTNNRTSGCSVLSGDKSGTFYLSLNELDNYKDYTIYLTNDGTCVVSDATPSKARALIRDLGNCGGTTSVSGTVTAYDFNSDGNTDLTMDKQSSGDSYRLVFTQQPGLLICLAKSGYDYLQLQNSEARQLSAIQEGVPFFQRVSIYPKCATLKLVGNGGRFMDGSTTLELPVRGSGKLDSYAADSLGLGDYRTAGFRSGYLPLCLAATKSGSDPVEFEDLYYMTFTEDTTLYMLWGKPVTVTINANGGKFMFGTRTGINEFGSEVSMEVPAGYRFGVNHMDHSIVRSGYTIKGWSTDKAGTAAVTPDSSGCLTVPSSDTTFYVQWNRPSEPVIVLQNDYVYSAVTHSSYLAVGEKLNLYCYGAGKGITYQWQYHTPTGTGWINCTMTGAQTPTMSVPVTVARDGYQYRCVVKDSSGATAVSHETELECYVGFYGPVNAAFGAVGDTVTFTAPVSGASSYQWQYSSDGGYIWYDSSMTGAKTATLSVPVTAARDGYRYRCVVTFVDGDMDFSGAGTLFVTDKFIDKVDLDLSFLHDGITTEQIYNHLMEEMLGGHYMADISGVVLIPAGMEAVLDQMTPEMIMDLPTLTSRQRLTPGDYIMGIAVAGVEGEVEPAAYYMSDPGPATETASVPVSGLLKTRSGASDTKMLIETDPHDIYQIRWDKLKVTLNGKTMTEGVDWIRYNDYYFGGDILLVLYRFTIADEAARIVVDPQNAAAPAGDYVVFEAETAGTAVAYQWQYCKSGSTTWNNSTGEGAKSSVLLVEATTARDGQQYRCVITDYKGRTATSKAATLTVSSKPVIVKSPKSVTAAVGSTATFTVSAVGSGQYALLYQWQYRTSSTGTWKDSTASGCHTDTLRINATTARNGYQYRCKVTDKWVDTTAYTSAATLTVTTVTKPTITTQPKSQTAAVGDTVKFTVKASGTGLSYQWYYRTSSTGTWTKSTLTGNATATLTVSATAARNGYQYKCKVSNSAGYVYTNAVTLTVTSAAKPTITTQPKSQTAAVGDTVKFTVKATGATAYQWYYRTSSTGTWTKSTLTGNATATLTVSATAARNGYQYKCKVSNSAGYVYTNAVTLTVGAKPTITTQPKSQTAAVDATVKFTVKATDATSYQWYYRTSSTGTWTAYDGGTSATLTLIAKSYRNGYQYKCKVSNAIGYVYSNAVTLTVNG